MIFAHQSLSQIKSDDVMSALSDCAIRLANSDDEASKLAPSFRATPEYLRSLNRGQFAMFIRDHTKQPLTINVANNPISEWPQMSPSEFQDIQNQMKRYCYEPSKETLSFDDPDDPPVAPTKKG